MQRDRISLVMSRWAVVLGLCAGLWLAPGAWGVSGGSACAQDAAEPAAANSTADASEEDSLSTKQEAISLRYRRFETTLLQLAEYLRQTDPDRAELLVRALGKSKETRIPDQLAELVQLLERGQLGDAIDSQETVVLQMQLVLTLLQSEDRQSELEREQQRIKALIRDVNNLIGKQTDARAMTERGAATDKAAEQQQKVNDQTQNLIEKIRQQDAERGINSDSAGKDGKDGSPSGSQGELKDGDSSQGSDSQDGMGKPGEKGSDGEQGGKPGDDPAGDAKPGEKSDGKPPGEKGSPSGDKPAGDKPDGDKPPGDKPPGDKPSSSDPSESGDDAGKPSSGKPMPGSPSGGKPQDGKPQDGDSSPSPGQPGQPSDEESPSGGGGSSQQQQQNSEPQDITQRPTPGRQELEEARKEMERAIAELQNQQRTKASEQQDKALAELLKAKEKLEEILRQLREEERELLLAALEARFRDMLGRQINVYNGTVGLAAVPEEQRTDRQRTRSIELARSQDEIALLAAKALTLLKEEGSSIAFPEAVVQIREDMLTSARRLERLEVGELTQSIQKDIIEALEEILDALQKELEKSKDRQQQQQQQQQQQPQDPALVDALAELKMLRSLQYRVNRRTKQIGRMVEGEQAAETDLVQQLRELSARQAKIQRTTYDLATGRNR